MYISKIQVENFRLLKNSTLELDKENKKDLSLLIGKNNSGKTSFIVLFDKFLKTNTTPNFSFDDFSLELRDKILDLKEETDEFELSIKLILEIRYTSEDSLADISDLILDLDPEVNTVKVLFECLIDKKSLLKELSSITNRRNEFIQKNIKNFFKYKIYVFSDDSDLKKGNRDNLIEKDRKSIDKLINFQVIHAKRDVASSESNDSAKKVLSKLATTHFDADNQISHNDLNEINLSLIEMDSTLDGKYLDYFDSFLENSRNFLNMTDLRVVSDLQSKEVLSNHSKIVYGSGISSLPEHLNGLGYMNILYLLLRIEIKKDYFIKNKKEINLLFIEEPEAHTHPQMQYVFIEKIKQMLNNIDKLQTFISSHSAHIVKNCNFEDIRYFQKDETINNISIKNFYSDLKEKYRDEDPKKDPIEKAHFKFLTQYLTLASSELFFAEKIIFIEGTTEKLLLPYFIKKYDEESADDIKLSSQNISILEVGANAKAFRHFINFLEIKTLIITDIDTTLKTVDQLDKISYPSSSVDDGTHTSNYTLKYFLNAPEYTKEVDWTQWFEDLKNNTLQDDSSKIKLAYQIEELGYQGRSFEDAFINVNFDKIKEHQKLIDGLKKSKEENLESFSNYYKLTECILDGKSEFASSILWLALTENFDWNTPLYIKEGLQWIAKK